jgi:hypothetical protein
MPHDEAEFLRGVTEASPHMLSSRMPLLEFFTRFPGLCTQFDIDTLVELGQLEWNDMVGGYMPKTSKTQIVATPIVPVPLSEPKAPGARPRRKRR